MRPPVNALAADLRKTAQAARETIAATLYELEALRTAMLGAAGAGFDYATIPGPDGLDLRDTPAAKAACAWLDTMKVTTRWDVRTGAAGADAASAADLVMSWKLAPVGR